MKKQFSIMAVAAALLVGVTSCNTSTKGEDGPTKTGDLQLTIGFTGPTTKAGASTAKPVTSWDKSVKSLQLLLVTPGTGNVIYAHNVNLATMTTVSGLSKKTAAISNVPAGVIYDLYLIANNNVATGATIYPNFMAGTATPIVVGTNINTVLLQLQAATDPNGHATAAATSFNQPTEIFLAKASVNVAPDNLTDAGTVNLERIVGLLRVRINKANVNVSAVDFAHADAGFRVRNVANQYNTVTLASVGTATNNTIFATGGFRTAADYTTLSTAGAAQEYADNFAGVTPNGMGLATAANADDFTFWRDFLSFPGGAASGSGRFNIVVSGMAPVGYVKADGSSVVAPGGELVYWTGPVDAALTANGILEMNVTLTSPGIGGPTVPAVGAFGNLEMTIDLKEWGAITSVNIGL